MNVSKGSKVIVVIEDDKDILDLMDYILTDAGYTVQGYSQLERLEKIIEHQPSLILLDVRLKDGSGDELCQSIKNNSATCHIPVVLVSAMPKLEATASKCKADAFIAKPFDLTELVNIVSKFVEGPALTSEAK
jgi:DNA-binding response OmpR family regulator